MFPLDNILQSSSDGKLTISYCGLVYNSNSLCHLICPEKKECPYYLKELGNGSISTNYKLTFIGIVVSNETSESIDFSSSYILGVDVDGFTHKAISLCPNYCFQYPSTSSRIPGNRKTKFIVILPPSINYIALEYVKYNHPITLNFNGNGNISYINAQQQIISELKNEIAKLQYDNRQLQNITHNNEQKSSNDSNTSHSNRSSPEMLLKYEIIEDDIYYRIISKEEGDTISFNREFDKSKGNFNWINIGDPLITMRADNTFRWLSAPTLISAPVSGIFEFNKNKLISFNEEVCRIRKIDQSLKMETIEALEREEIKSTVLKKERKKMIERQTLDELIDEGKVFNIYTKKDGNRTSIPLDVANAVWNRDGGKCCICGCRENLEFDHIIPLAKGGATSFRNLQLLCHNCNMRKSDKI